MPEIPVYIVHPNQQHCQEILAVVDSLGDADLVPSILTDLRHAPDECRRRKVPVVIVGVDLANDPAIRAIDHISQLMGQNISIIVVTKNPAPEVMVPCTRAGADDFVTFPVNPEEMHEAIERQLQRRGLRASEEGRIIAVFSGKGGIGATLLACNLAANIASLKKGKRSCAILDLNVQFGVVAEMMDVKCKYTLADAIRDRERLDPALLEEFMTAHPSGARVLAAPGTVEEFDPHQAESLPKILDLCRDTFRYTVIDLPHAIDGVTVPVLDAADEILLLCDLLFPTIRNTQKVLDTFQSLEYRKEKIKLVMNGYYKNDKVSLRDINSALKRPIFWLVPYDSLLARESIDAGVTVASINPGSDLAESLTTLAQHITGSPIKVQPKRRFSIFGFR
jgi:pilus assembly protein CpaE